jgi:hypothetical protein
MVEDRNPVITAIREGLHKGAEQYACSNSTPLEASRSILGVFA